MLNHYADLYTYDTWANQRCLEAIPDNSSPDEPALALLNHVLGAKKLWLLRLTGGDYQSYSPFPERIVAETAIEIDAVHDEWGAYLSNLDATWLAAACRYTDTKGNPRKAPVGHILYHVLNHGSHHRGQICSRLRQRGIDPPVLDYIYYSYLQQGLT